MTAMQRLLAWIEATPRGIIRRVQFDRECRPAGEQLSKISVREFGDDPPRELGSGGISYGHTLDHAAAHRLKCMGITDFDEPV